MPRWSSKITLKFEEMPANDRAAIEAATKPGDVLDPGGPAENWSPATLAANIARYGRFLGYLDRMQLLDANASPADRVTRETVGWYLESLKADMASDRISSETIHAYIRGLLNTMLKIAPGDWAWLRVVAENARKTAVPSRNKQAKVRHIRELYQLGKSLMDQAEDPSSGTPLERAVCDRDGLKIAILAARAPRRGCLSCMEIDNHLKRVGDLYWAVFDETETKQKKDAELFLPADLTPYVEQYLHVHRRVLLSYAKVPHDDPAVWLSEKGYRLGAPAIRYQVCLRTEKAFGVPITPHLFRDCLGTSIAYDLPDQIHIAAPILQHPNLDMMERHYNQADSHKAFTALHSHVAEMRKELDHYLDGAALFET
jgi:hypothetical protein